MSVGDIVNPLVIADQYAVELVAARGDLAAGVPLENLARLPLFRLPQGLTPPKHRMPSVVGRAFGGLAKHRATDRALSLIQLLDARSDVYISGTRHGSEAVAVPFSHVWLLTGILRGRPAAGLLTELRQEIRDAFGDHIDPFVDVRAEMRDPIEVGERELRAFFGRGVFVPAAGERPIGTIEVEFAVSQGGGQSYSVEPRLADGRPAAVYRGQTGLAFGASFLAAPAVCDGLDDDRWVFFVGPSEGAEEARPPGRRGAGRQEEDPSPIGLMIIDTASGLVTRESPFHIGRSEADAPFEAAFEVYRGGRPLFRLRYAAGDRRPSRLLARPPPRAWHYEIAGVVMPGTQSEDGVIARAWIDIDRNGHLVAAPGLRRHESLVCEDDELAVYSWADYRFRDPSQSDARLVLAGDGRERLRIMRAPRSRPFGYLAAPVETGLVVFEGDWWRHEGYAVDWLDFAGAAEPITAAPQRLAAYAARRYRGELMPALSDDDAPRRLLRPSTGRHEVEVVADRGVAAPGDEFLVGPLLLRVAAGRP